MLPGRSPLPPSLPLSLFLRSFPLLTRGGIINPTLKTACRDRARFRRDFRSLKIPTRLHFSVHIHFSLYFLSGFTTAPSWPFPFRLLSLLFPSPFLSQSLHERKINYIQCVRAAIVSSSIFRSARRVLSVPQRFATRVHFFIIRKLVGLLIAETSRRQMFPVGVRCSGAIHYSLHQSCSFQRTYRLKNSINRELNR